ncbi:MAG: peptide deformylase [Sandaracinaceae bacterium]|nr:peptide deformylase [Sandaracinaceae bacterium]
MAIRTILHYPDKRLRNPGRPVTEFGPELERLVEDMAETMYAAPGVGLAATQIGEPMRLFIIDVAVGEDEPSDLKVFVNPEIVERTGTQSWEEGCLSFPGVHEEIERAERVRVRAQDAKGEVFELEADGLLAVAIQHENDHLDGKLMIDHLGLIRRRLVHRQMTKRATSAGGRRVESRACARSSSGRPSSRCPASTPWRAWPASSA